jgi:predicted site-specific integrase-resolvase
MNVWIIGWITTLHGEQEGKPVLVDRVKQGSDKHWADSKKQGGRMRAVIYARVSTDLQEREETVQSQCEIMPPRRAIR